MPVIIGIVALAKYLLIGGFIPCRVVQAVGCVKMLFPVNGNFITHISDGLFQLMKLL
jgi:hypothetical protein